MKKVLILVLIMSGLTSLSQAQFKPERGNFTTELQFSPFNFNVKVDYDEEKVDYSTGPFSMPGFRFRYFFSEKLALRTTIGLNFDHDKISRNLDETIQDYYHKYEYSGKYIEKNRYTAFSIAPGLEYHFGDWDRMSLYVGGELFLGFKTSKGTIEDNREGMYYERDWYSGEYFYVGTFYSEKFVETKNCKRVSYCDSYGCREKYVQNAPLFFGFNALIGMDFYIYKGLYMGAELGFGYTFETYLKGYHKETITSNLEPQPITTEDKAEDKISAGNLSFRYNPMIRLGWRF